MISIGYQPETGLEHLVPDAEPHPGDHLLNPECPCGPRYEPPVWGHEMATRQVKILLDATITPVSPIEFPGNPGERRKRLNAAFAGDSGMVSPHGAAKVFSRWGHELATPEHLIGATYPEEASGG